MARSQHELTRLAIAVRLFLQQSGVEQKELAEQLGCSPSALTRFLRGETTLESKTVINLIQWMMQPDRINET